MSFEPFIPQAEPYNPAHDDDIPTAQPVPGAPATNEVPDYGAFAEEQRAAWDENRRRWERPHPDVASGGRGGGGRGGRRERRQQRRSRQGTGRSTPPVFQRAGRRHRHGWPLCRCAFRIVRGAVKLPFFAASVVVCLPVSAVGAMVAAASAPFYPCSRRAARVFRRGQHLLIAPCRAGALWGEPFAPKGGFCDRIVARQNARYEDERTADGLPMNPSMSAAKKCCHGTGFFDIVCCCWPRACMMG